MTHNRGTILIAISILTGGARASATPPVDSVADPTQTLKEVVVGGTARKTLRGAPDGRLDIRAGIAGDLPSFMGGGDPVALLRSLPAVQTSAELQPGIFVRGSGNGANHFESDGARVVNPMHLLGLYSAFNPAFYSRYIFRAGYMPPSTPSVTGGFFGAYSSMSPDTVVNGDLSLGLIESHTALGIPIVRGKAALRLGFRKSYLSLLFPDILKLGDSRIKYGFTDVNLAFIALPGGGHELKASAFADADRMKLMSNRNGSKSGDFGWKNLATSLEWRYRGFTTIGSFSRFSNSFLMEEGGRLLDLPSSLWQAGLSSSGILGEFEPGVELIARRSSGLTNRGIAGEHASGDALSFEGSLSGLWKHGFGGFFDLEAGLRLTYYQNRRFRRLVPQPRMQLRFRLPANLSLRLSYGRLARFDRLVEMTTGGLPADFTVCADSEARPEDVHSFEIGADGFIPGAGITITADIYYKLLRHTLEYTGSLLDMTSPSFSPMSRLADGKGYACGLSLSLMRQIGKVRGRIGYNLGTSRVRSAATGDVSYPTSHDRTHDLTANVAWDVIRGLTLSASFTYATGTPYTKAKYGYMIGENLICEYYPHNSSRLPDYSRLDFSCNWTFLRRGRMKHSLNLSVYNALATRNILFIYTDYSLDKGIRHRESVMKSIIPAVGYNFEF